MWKGTQRNFARAVRPRTLPSFRSATKFPTAELLEKETKLWKSMKNLTQNSITKLDCGLSVINLGMKLDPASVSSDLLFVRDFYPDLLEDIRKVYKVILLGNPGISKSYFHHYYLARIMNPSLFGPLTRDFWGSTDPPEIVIRQICGEEIQVYDRSQETVYKLPSNTDIFLDVDYTKSVYLVEPGTTVREQPYLVDVPTLATVPPDTRFYKEFEKERATRRYYMPCYSLEELLDLGRYLRENNRVPQDMENYYTKEGIEKSFAQFGGIIRHVFPQSISLLRDITQAQSKAIKHAIANNRARSILAFETIENQRVSHYIGQYEVARKPEGNEIRFRSSPLNIINSQVYDQLEEAFLNIDTLDMIETLTRNDKSGSMSDVCPILYEKLLSDKLISVKGLTCQQQELNLLTTNSEIAIESDGEARKVHDKWVEYTCNLKDLQIGKPPSYDQMTPNTLYYPTPTKKSKFPFAEFFYKNNEGNLVAFQVTRQKSSPKLISQDSFTQFMEAINFPTEKIETQFKLILIPGPQQADSMHLNIDFSASTSTPSSSSLNLIKTYTVLKIDSSYDQLKPERRRF